MTLEGIYYVSQIVAVIAIFASLVFVGVQLRQNTKALKASSHHAITDSFNAINNLVLSDPKVARIWRLAVMGTTEELNEEERISVNFMLLANFRIFETLYYQYKNGTLDKKLFDAELKTLKWAVRQPGFMDWWPNNPISLSDEFRAFIDDLIREAAPQAGPQQ
jgi:hypothetical protein